MPTTKKTDEEWRAHLELIAQLYIKEGYNHEAIANRLRLLDFDVSGAKVKTRLAAWKIKRYSETAELRLMAQRLLHARQQGNELEFRRLGKLIPSEDIDAYLREHPETQLSEETLPAHLQYTVLSPAIAANDSGRGQRDDGEGTVDPEPRAVLQARPDKGKQARRPTKRLKRVALPNSPISAPDESDPDQHDLEAHARHRRILHKPDAGCRCCKAAFKTVWNRQPLRLQSNSMEGEPTEAMNQGFRIFDAVPHGEADSRQTKEPTGLTPLHWAAYHNDRSFADALLRKGADVNLRGGLEWSPLHIAAMYGHFTLVNLFLMQNGIEVNVTDANGVTPLLYAIRGRPSNHTSASNGPFLDCALLLIRDDADVDLGLLDGRTALHLSCAAKGLDRLVKVISAKTKKRDDQDRNGSTAIHIALRHGNEGYVKTLMAADASLNMVDSTGRTPIHIAGLYATAELLSEMIEKTVDLSMRDSDDETILHLVCRRNLYAIAKEIAEKPGVDVNAKSRRGKTPLIIAAGFGHLETVKMLIGKCADTTARDEHLDTALIAAMKKRHRDVMEYLLDLCPLDAKNMSVKSWQASLEHDRKAEKAISAPTGQRLPEPRSLSLANPHTIYDHATLAGPSAVHSQLACTPGPYRGPLEAAQSMSFANHGRPNVMSSLQEPRYDPEMDHAMWEFHDSDLTAYPIDHFLEMTSYPSGGNATNPRVINSPGQFNSASVPFNVQGHNTPLNLTSNGSGDFHMSFNTAPNSYFPGHRHGRSRHH